MNTNTSIQYQKRKLLAPTLLMLLSIFLAGGASAQAVVTDPAHTQLTMTGWIKELISQGKQHAQQIQQYQKQIQEYNQQVKQYQQMLVNLRGFKGGPGYREKFPERHVNTGVLEKCGSSPSKNPVGLEQHKYCTAIVQTQNRRFNAMVNVLRDVEKRDDELQAAYTERASIKADDLGDLQSNTNHILAIQGQMQNDVQSAKTMMETYDALLLGLKDDQVGAANSALKNKGGLLGDVVQGVALRTALKAARTRER